MDLRWRKMESKIIHGDCIDVMRTFQSNSIDIIITDPPYFVPVEHYKTRKKFGRNFGDLGILESFFKIWFRQVDRILKKDGFLFMFCDGQSYPLFFYHSYPLFQIVRPLIWDKKVSFNGYYWRHQHELILFGVRPERHKIPTGDGDILRCSAVKVDKRKHPAEKPVELIKKFIEKVSLNEDDIILDPFAGCGSVMEACIECNRKYIMIEKDLSYFQIIKEREQKLKTKIQITYKLF